MDLTASAGNIWPHCLGLHQHTLSGAEYQRANSSPEQLAGAAAAPVWTSSCAHAGSSASALAWSVVQVWFDYREGGFKSISFQLCSAMALHPCSVTNSTFPGFPVVCFSSCLHQESQTQQ